VKRRLQISDEDWQKLGYSIERRGEAGRILRPHAGSPRKGTPAKSESSEADPRREQLHRYQRLINRIIVHFSNRGPLRPKEYEQIYRDNKLDELYRAVVELGGSPLLCEECLGLLRGRQRKYCSPRCRKTLRVRKQRERHPEYKAKRK